jgi:hypothetical protein
MSLSWSPQQREALEAMGLPVYRMAGATAPAAARTDASTAAPAAARTDASTAAPAAIRGESAAASTLDPLMLALLRAAGLGRDAAPLTGDWPAPQTLRRDPQAKRALWPRLRALRRSPT